MTTIAYRDGVMAADSRITYEQEASGTIAGECTKAWLIHGKNGKPRAMIGLAGESGAGLVFEKWLRDALSGGAGRTELVERLLSGQADFTALVITDKGGAVYDRWCVPDPLTAEFWAIGSGAKAALGAMHAGASAEEAVKIACRIDPYSAGPVVTLRLG